MAIFHNLDESRICLVKEGPAYKLVKKNLKKGKTHEEEVQLRRAPVVECQPADGLVHKRGSRMITLAQPLVLVDFSKHLPQESGSPCCLLPGMYPMDHLVISTQGRIANVVVLRNTTLGLTEQGLESVLAKQKLLVEQGRTKARLISLIAHHFGIPVQELSPDFVLPYVNGLGTKVGNGPYRSWVVLPKQKPVLIRAGMTIAEIAEQLL